MKHRALTSTLYFRLLPVSCALLPTLMLLAGCGGVAASDGAGTSGAGSSAAGASMGNAGNSAAAGSSGAGATSSAGAASGGSAGAGASCTGGGSFLGPDGCNQCSCLDGELVCTQLACEPMYKSCGGLAGIACPAGQYCKYPDGEACGASDQGGACVPSPGGCTADYAPVCGCGGKSYGNACSAAAASVSVAHAGVCDAAPPGSCSVTADGVSYPDGTSNIPAGDGCNVCSCAMGALTCTKRPCKAPTACGARAGDTCAATEYCAYTAGQLCGAADAEAVCYPRPSACSTLYQPVCGCDRKTYPNACSASLAGSGVLQNGACPGG
ncbi:MAG: Kazal-type serine protease inhibitor domain-containing protein [Pseudomonadota bacterium]